MSGAANPLNPLLFSNMIFPPPNVFRLASHLWFPPYVRPTPAALTTPRRVLTKKLVLELNACSARIVRISQPVFNSKRSSDIVHCHQPYSFLKSSVCLSFIVSIENNGNAADASRICSPCAETLSRACRGDRWRLAPHLCAVS